MKLLAFDTSTDRMSIAVTDGARTWQHSGPGSAQSSGTLIPVILGLMRDAGLNLSALDAIVFGRGPGSFTGLRTACAVAQGLAFGANVPVLPLDTLMAVAEEARLQQLAADAAETLRITAVLDARMDELYVQTFDCSADGCRALASCVLVRPEALAVGDGVQLLAGNVFAVYPDRLSANVMAMPRVETLPTATAMLRLAPALVSAGACVTADEALPLYVRDKVAQTTEERLRIKADAARAAALLVPATPAAGGAPR
ncbi:MAG: tRNA (adenosine(37)-N6)-threonylcarbamoyltransferase complex dimerization subunit type 1 TsaB [Comamonadaceae bacterium]|nr:MAG: tRNA (adenosine(37)-N6)-threonylcarbamoyltransferase complex dimerization subunit type 1 TsaB [Comamonadaceae bacterium]